MRNTQEVEELKDLLKGSVDKVYEETPSLFTHKGIEQAIVFRVGVYLQEALKESSFSNLQLDSEYNKSLDRPKRTPNYKDGIRPDLLIHQRGDHSNNKLAVEFKGWWNDDHGDDISKLKDLTSPEYDYKYSLGIFVDLQPSKAIYRFFQHGKEEQV